MSIDRNKISKVETIIAALNPAEQQHVYSFLADIVRRTPGAPSVPGTFVSPAAVAASHAPASAGRPGSGFTRFNMHQLLRREDLIEFTDRAGHLQRCRISSINTKTVSCESVTGTGSGWRVPPHMVRLVGQHPPIAAAAPAHVPTAAHAGNW